jgi:hypothetical protein
MLFRHAVQGLTGFTRKINRGSDGFGFGIHGGSIPSKFIHFKDERS